MTCKKASLAAVSEPSQLRNTEGRRRPEYENFFHRAANLSLCGGITGLLEQFAASRGRFFRRSCCDGMLIGYFGKRRLRLSVLGRASLPGSTAR
jgi:hypothetical protein